MVIKRGEIAYEISNLNYPKIWDKAAVRALFFKEFES
jgi:hypothetical protein